MEMLRLLSPATRKEISPLTLRKPLIRLPRQDDRRSGKEAINPHKEEIGQALPPLFDAQLQKRQPPRPQRLAYRRTRPQKSRVLYSPSLASRPKDTEICCSPHQRLLLRNKIEHRSMPQLDPSIFGECQAMLLNFDEMA